jgi:PhzF family phenazine biosynthesis protein
MNLDENLHIIFLDVPIFYTFASSKKDINSMIIKNFLIDAFCEDPYLGNPACVIILQQWLADETLQRIAKENGVPETAFYVKDSSNYSLRWFTPDIEMDLCGHATLATAFCLYQIMNINQSEFVFNTKSGPISVFVHNDIYELHLPIRNPIPSSLPKEINDALNIKPIAVFKDRDYLLLYRSETEIKNIKIDRSTFDKINLDPGGVIVTAVGERSHFVSRFFTPQATILEDPVTGSAHCSLIPFWSEKLNLKKMTAIQLSDRKGKLYCELFENVVSIKGKAKLSKTFYVDLKSE